MNDRERHIKHFGKDASLDLATMALCGSRYPEYHGRWVFVCVFRPIEAHDKIVVKHNLRTFCMQVRNKN